VSPNEDKWRAFDVKLAYSFLGPQKERLYQKMKPQLRLSMPSNASLGKIEQ
jgi:hypothetical protein